MFDLRELAGRRYVGLSLCAKAQEIRTIANRYAHSARPHGRIREDMPQHTPEIPGDRLWRAFKSGPIMPLAERQRRNIFAEGGAMGVRSLSIPLSAPGPHGAAMSCPGRRADRGAVGKTDPRPSLRRAFHPGSAPTGRGKKEEAVMISIPIAGMIRITIGVLLGMLLGVALAAVTAVL